MRSLPLLVLGFSLGCGGAAPEPARAPVAIVVPPAPAPAPTPRATALHRREVVGFVESGFGSFLQRVQVEPSLAAGRFRGWTIVELRPAVFWDAVDLKPGDVVTSVNGLPIERETQAYDAFESLRTANELRVAYYRDGTERTLAYPIVE